MTNSEKNIAEAVRYPHRLEHPAGELLEQARRLRASVAVAERWIEAAGAESGEPGEMWHQATYTRDRLQQELAGVALEIEVRRRDASFTDAGRPAPEGITRAAVLSDTLLEVYTHLADAADTPAEALCPEAERDRYRLMGAVLAAQETANAELTRLDPRHE